MEGNLLYPAHQAGTKYINIAKDLSAVNGKNEEITTRDGHLYAYIVEVTSFASANSLNFLSTIPNTWRVRNAFRKFHFARQAMFDKAGITKSEMGKYGQTMRPYFSLAHRADGELTPKKMDVPGITAPTVIDYVGGEWSYTQLASSPTVEDNVEAADLDLPLSDTWDIHVLGGHKGDPSYPEASKVWESCGMVHAYNQDRQSPIPDSDGTTYPGSTVEGQNNPLAALMTQSLTSGEILDIATFQEEEKAPYDILNNGDSQDAVIASTFYMTASGTASTRRIGTIVVPAGLLAIQSTETNGNGLHLNVVGKVLCKDLE